MSKRNTERERATAATAPAAGRVSVTALPEADRIVWIAAFCVLGLCVLALMWYPVTSMGWRYTQSNFDGFTLHYEEAVARGEKLYGAPPKWTWENYPPLWFHAIAIFGSIIHDFNLAGRLVCLAAYAA